MATKIVHFMTPWQGVLVTGHGHFGHILQNVLYFFKKNHLLYTRGKRQNKFFSNDEQGLNSKYENSTFQDSCGRGSPANVWPY